MIWPYLIGGILAVAILWVLRMRLILWSYEPVVYRGLTAMELRPLICSWGPWLEKRGKIVISHEATDAEVELRKFRYKGRPDALVYRFRIADATSKYFDAVKDAFDGALIDYRIALTPKRKRPRAIEVALEAEDLFMPVAAVHLIETTFGGLGKFASDGFSIRCEGEMRDLNDRPEIELVPWRNDVRAGYKFGHLLGRLRRRLG